MMAWGCYNTARPECPAGIAVLIQAGVFFGYKFFVVNGLSPTSSPAHTTTTHTPGYCAF